MKPFTETPADPVRRRPARIEIRLPQEITATQERELAALVRYCVLRSEREVGLRRQWTVTLSVVANADYGCTVAVDDLGDVIDAVAFGRDPALAAWDAMCGVERTLRDRHLS